VNLVVIDLYAASSYHSRQWAHPRTLWGRRSPTASAWYTSPHCGHVTSIMFAVPCLSDGIISYFGILRHGWP
jgi:hypothetical protein